MTVNLRGTPAVGSRPARRREEFEALGLLVGMLAVLLLLVAAVGATTPYGP